MNSAAGALKTAHSEGIQHWLPAFPCRARSRLL